MLSDDDIIFHGLTKLALELPGTDLSSHQEGQLMNAAAQHQGGADALGRLPGDALTVAGFGLARRAAGSAASDAAKWNFTGGSVLRAGINPVAAAGRYATAKNMTRTGKALGVVGKYGPLALAVPFIGGMAARAYGAHGAADVADKAVSTGAWAVNPLDQAVAAVGNKVSEIGGSVAQNFAAPATLSHADANARFLRNMNNVGTIGGAGVGGGLGYLLGRLFDNGGAGALLGTGLGAIAGNIAAKNTDWSPVLSR